MHPAIRQILERAAAVLRQAGAALRRHPWRIVLLPPALVLLYVLALVPFTPGIGDLRKAKVGMPSVLLATDGSVLAVYKNINREWVPLDKVAASVVNALIAIEDRRFFQHHGIDLRRTGGALLSTLRGELQGGSTLTQQLARNLYPDEIGRAASITRKIKEDAVSFILRAQPMKAEETVIEAVPDPTQHREPGRWLRSLPEGEPGGSLRPGEAPTPPGTPPAATPQAQRSLLPTTVAHHPLLQ